MKTFSFPPLSKRFRAVALLLPLAVLPACESPGLAGAAIGTGGALFAGGLLTRNPGLAIAGGALAAGAAGGLIAGGVAQQNRGAFGGANLNPPVDPHAGYIQGQQPYGYGYGQQPRDLYTDRRGQYYDPRLHYQQPPAYIQRERITVGPVDPYLAQQAGCFVEGQNHTGGLSYRCPPHIDPRSIQVRPRHYRPGWGS